MKIGKLVSMDFREYTCMSYVIKQGDTLYNISRANNIPLALILRANPYVDIYNLQVGDELCIPVNNSETWSDIISYVVEESESLQSILNRFGIELSDLLEFNNLDEMMIAPGSTIQIPTYENQ